MTFKKPMDVRIELWNTKSDHQFMEYESFLVYSESDNFKMEIGKNTRGTLIDWLHSIHNGYSFYARDRDNTNRNAHVFKGGWWFGSNNKLCLTCSNSLIETWSESGNGSVVYDFVKMMIKPATTKY